MQRRKQSRLSPLQAFNMGSKMSFGRGSGGQNTASEFTSETSLPHRIVPVPSDCKQVSENERCTEDSRWVGEMKETSLNQPSPESNPSEHLESDGHVGGSETGGRANCQRSEDVSSQVRMSTRSGACSSTTNSYRKPSKGRRKRERPRNVLPPSIQDPGVPAPDEDDGTKVPSPACLINHSSDHVPNTDDNHLIGAPSHSETSSPVAVAKEEAGGDVTLLSKRKRGRPKKAAASRGLSVSSRVVCSPAWSLRSRAGQHPSTQSEESLSKDGQRQRDVTPTEGSNTAYNHGVKRRRKRRKFPVNQQVPVKVSKLDDSQEGLPVLTNDVDFGGKEETDKQVEPSTDTCKTETHKTNTGRNSSQFSPHSGEKQEKLPDLLSELESPSEDSNRFNLVDPAQTKIKPSVDTNSSEESLSKSVSAPLNADSQGLEPSSTDVVTSSEETPKSAGSLSVAKDEHLEPKLDHPSPLSRPDSSITCASTTVKSEDLIQVQHIFRRKRGGKRRRRISNVVIRREQLVEKQAPSCDAQQKPDEQKEASSDVSTNLIYIKKGNKTLLKCGYCFRVYKFMSQLVIHQRVHTGERPFKCPECGRGFSKNSNLNLHLKTHKKNDMHQQKCQICNVLFSASDYASHMMIHELELEFKDTKSEKRRRQSVRDNSQGVQGGSATENKKGKVCQYCGKSFTFQSALVRHVRIHTGEKPYKCDICGKAFGQAYFLRVHELTHWPVKRYNCTRCGKSFGHYSNAKNHTCRPLERCDDDMQSNRRTKPPLTYTCHICKNIFEELREFNSHMKEHTGTKLLRCLYCDKLFSVMSEFNAHRSRCTADRNTSSALIKGKEMVSLIRYKVPTTKLSSGHNSAPATDCELKKKPRVSCKKRPANFKSPFQTAVIPPDRLSHLVSKLNQLDNRSDPRKYLCPSCGRQFRHMGRLRAHMLTHAPGQSYTCSCCGKTLRSWSKLWYHQRIHRRRGGRFTCPQCGRGFRFAGPYKKHMTEHPEFKWVENRPRKVFEPYQCEQCSCGFKTLDLLFRHQLCHSSSQDLPKDSDFELLMDDHSSQSNNNTSSPASDNNPLSPSHKYPDPVSQKTPGAPLISFVTSQDSNVVNSTQLPNRVLLVQEREPSPDRLTAIPSQKQFKPVGAVKTHTTNNTSKTNEGPSDNLDCALCGKAFPAVSDLFHHYLQHARGQV